MILKIFAFLLFFNTLLVDLFSDDHSSILLVQPDSKQYYELCEADKDNVWDYVYQKKKQEFLDFIDYASAAILNTKHEIIGSPDPKEWEKAFRKAQLGWLEQLELERDSHFYSESGLGGNCNYRDSVRFAVESIDNRIKELKKSWWLQHSSRFKVNKGTV